MEFSAEREEPECHLTWIDKILSSEDFENLVDSNSRENYVFEQLEKSKAKKKWLQKNAASSNSSTGGVDDKEAAEAHKEEDKGEGKDNWEEDEDDEDDDDDGRKQICHKQMPKWATYLAIQLNKAAKIVRIGDVDWADKQLGKVGKILEELEGVHKDRLYEVGMYCADSLHWHLSKMKIRKMEEGRKKESELENHVRDLVKLKDKWRSFQGPGTRAARARAVILFLEQQLKKSLLPCYNNQEELKTLQEVIKLDPGYHMWFYYAMDAKRRVRCSDKQTYLGGPSEEEIKWCWMAYDLEPNIVLTKFDCGMILKEILGMKEDDRLKYLEEMEEIMLPTVDEPKCLEYFDMALDLANTDGLKYWELKIKIAKGELLLRTQNRDRASRQKGLRVLLECLESYPNNVYLHQKLARLYQNGKVLGKSPDNRKVSNKKAEVHYKQALQLQKRNYFVCLRGYLELVPYLEPPLESKEILSLLVQSLDIEKSLETLNSMGVEDEVAQIQVWKACLQWQENSAGDYDPKRKACEEWIEILQKYPQLQDKILKAIWNPPFVRRRPAKIYYRMDTEYLNKILGQLKMESNEEAAFVAIHVLLKECEKKLNVSSGGHVPRT